MVAPSSLLRNHQLLWHRSGEKQIVSKRLSSGDRRFAAINLTPEMQQMLRLPEKPLPTTGEELFEKLRYLLQEKIGLEQRPAALIAAWIMTSHLAGAINVPLLNLFGPSGVETNLIQFLSSVVRHPLPIAEPSLRELLALPAGLRPTLLLSQPPMTLVRRLLQATNISGLAFLRAGSVLHLACSAVVVTSQPLSVSGLKLSLTGLTPSGSLTIGELDRLAEEMQPQLLHFRLRQWQAASVSSFDMPALMPTTRNIACVFGATLENAPQAQAAVCNALTDVNEDQRIEQSEGPLAVVLEALLRFVHKPRTVVSVIQVSNCSNLIYRERGERLQLTPRAVGSVLRLEVGLSLKRANGGYQLTLDSQTCARIYQRAAAAGVLALGKPIICELPPAAEPGKSAA